MRKRLRDGKGTRKRKENAGWDGGKMTAGFQGLGGDLGDG